MAAISTDKLTKNYGKARGITDLDLCVEEGDFFGFIGPIKGFVWLYVIFNIKENLKFYAGESYYICLLLSRLASWISSFKIGRASCRERVLHPV